MTRVKFPDGNLISATSLYCESLNLTTFVFEISASPRRGSQRVEYLFDPAGAALGKGAFGQGRSIWRAASRRALG